MSGGEVRNTEPRQLKASTSSAKMGKGATTTLLKSRRLSEKRQHPAHEKWSQALQCRLFPEKGPSYSTSSTACAACGVTTVPGAHGHTPVCHDSCRPSNLFPKPGLLVRPKARREAFLCQNWEGYGRECMPPQSVGPPLSSTLGWTLDKLEPCEVARGHSCPLSGEKAGLRCDVLCCGWRHSLRRHNSYVVQFPGPTSEPMVPSPAASP